MSLSESKQLLLRCHSLRARSFSCGVTVWEQGVAPVVSLPCDYSFSQAHSGQTEPSGWLSELGPQCAPYWMDTLQSGFSSGVGSVFYSRGGLFQFSLMAGADLFDWLMPCHHLVRSGGLCIPRIPPLPSLGWVVRKARADQVHMILFAPRWPSQPWFTDLIELSRGPPLQLPLSRNLLVKLRSRIRCNSPESLNLHTWLLCGTDLPDIIMLSDLSRPLSLAKSRCPYMIHGNSSWFSASFTLPLMSLWPPSFSSCSHVKLPFF